MDTRPVVHLLLPSLMVFHAIMKVPAVIREELKYQIHLVLDKTVVFNPRMRKLLMDPALIDRHVLIQVV